MLHTIMPALYVALALGAGYFTFFMYRRADLYYNRHRWYKMAMATQGAIAVTAVMSIVTGNYGLALPPALLFLFFTLKAKSASEKLISEELTKTKALYNDIK